MFFPLLAAIELATPAAIIASMETRVNKALQQKMRLWRTRTLLTRPRFLGFDISGGPTCSLAVPTAPWTSAVGGML